MDEPGARKQFETALAHYRQDFDTFFLARFLGLDIRYPDSRCVVTFPVSDFLFNPQGSYHGGLLSTVMDVSMGHLVRRTSGVPGLTLEIKTQFLRPLTEGPATCEGRFLRRGRSVSHLEARVHDAGNRLVAFATSTWKMGVDATSSTRPG